MISFPVDKILHQPEPIRQRSPIEVERSEISSRLQSREEGNAYLTYREDENRKEQVEQEAPPPSEGKGRYVDFLF